MGAYLATEEDIANRDDPNIFEKYCRYYNKAEEN